MSLVLVRLILEYGSTTMTEDLGKTLEDVIGHLLLLLSREEVGVRGQQAKVAVL